MRRILAFVCIFILLLFTGIPMFTSNLLCNETRVYADSVPDQLYSDREKVIAALTVYFNQHNGVLKVLNNGNSVSASQYATTVYDMYIGTFITYYRYEQATIQTLADIAGYIDVENDPFIVRMYSPAVAFFNAFLQWMMDKNGITNSPSGSDGLYNGYSKSGNLFYIVSENPSYVTDSLQKLYNSSSVTVGSPVDGTTYNILLENYLHKASMSLNDFQNLSNYDTVKYSYGNINFASDVTYSNFYLKRINDGSKVILAGSNNSTQSSYITLCYIYDSGHRYYGNPCWFQFRDEGANQFHYGIVTHDTTNNRYKFTTLGNFTRNSSINNANINFDKNGFDSDPTSAPSGSDGLAYQPKQNGTGNTYNNYNNYYNDYYAGDTYITNPGQSGGGGGGDNPGGEGEDPTPGGTSPPWDGSGSDGLYSQGGTLTPDGNGGYNLNFPDVGLPDLNIDWSINGLKDKFPFSIPWDLMAFFAVMNAEPETPYIQADIPLGLWEWNIDWDLHAFDNVARILRNMELIGFCIGLILITRSIIKG